MTTWIQVMAEVRAMDDRRRSGKGLDGADAEKLVSMILEFHKQAVAISASGEYVATVQGAPPQRR
jgi:hypothetical protein